MYAIFVAEGSQFHADEGFNRKHAKSFSLLGLRNISSRFDAIGPDFLRCKPGCEQRRGPWLASGPSRKKPAARFAAERAMQASFTQGIEKRIRIPNNHDRSHSSIPR